MWLARRREACEPRYVGWLRDSSRLRTARASGIVALLVVLLAAVPASAADIDVDSTADAVADDGTCSLREAISAANEDTASGGQPGECAEGAGADMVLLPAGIYTLSRAGASEDANGTGDLDLAGDLTLAGSGALTAEIDAGELDRVIDVLPASAHAFVDAVTVTGGRTPDGEDGFIYSDSDEVAPTQGGPAVASESEAHDARRRCGRHERDWFRRGRAPDPVGPCDESTPSANGGDGGGIAVENSELLVSRSTIRGNITGTGGHPGVANECAIAGNSGSGAGISTDGGTVLVEASTIAGNQTGAGGETVLSGGTNGTNGPGGGINNHQVPSNSPIRRYSATSPAALRRASTRPTHQPSEAGGLLRRNSDRRSSTT